MQGSEAVTATSRRGARLAPAAAAGLLLLAAAVWGGVFLWRQRDAPVRRHIEAGREFALRGQARPAEQEWLKALRLDPKNAVAFEALGELYLSTGNWAGGAGVFARLAAIRPALPQVHSRLAVCLLRAGDEVGAFQAAQKELKRNPDDVAAVTITSLLSSNMGEFQKELSGLRRLIELDPKNVPLLTLLAENLTFTHKYDEARKVIGRILAVDPNHAEAYALRGACWFNSDTSPAGQARAEEDFRRSLQANPLAPFPRLYLGKIYRRQRQPERAVTQLELARKLTPGKVDIWFELAGAYEQAGNSEQAAFARKRFQELRGIIDRRNSLLKKCAVNPDNFDDSLELGNLALREGDVRIARIYLARARDLRPSDRRPREGLNRLARLSGEAPGEAEALKSTAAAHPSRRR